MEGEGKMNKDTIAPCGIICDLCYGFQRTKDRCKGCNAEGWHTSHCENCRIKNCPEKQGDTHLLCIDCPKFPCRRIRDLEKRYTMHYGESPIQNMREIKEVGLEAFITRQEELWRCDVCGALLCVHRDRCLSCSAERVVQSE
jgi:hypothetical protein